MTNHNRREFLKAMAVGGMFWTTKGAFAQQLLTTTPAQTIGPYYPDRMPLDQDNDLVVINDAITPAVGQLSWITGRVLDRRGDPIRGALVEIWQADDNGAYIHSASPIANRDRNFQGYGRFVTGSSGQYLFRTVKPGLYPGRTRHVHYQVTTPSGVKLVTQLYVDGDSRNASDGILRGLTTAQRSMVVMPWSAVAESTFGELAVTFDLVLGYTPADNVEPTRPTLVAMVNAATQYPGGASAGLVTLVGAGLDGATAYINQQPATIVAASATQLTLQTPDTNGGRVEVVVATANGESQPLTAELQPLMPGLFLRTGDYLDAVREDGSAAETAQAGEVLAITGTGFGPASQGSNALLNPVRIQIDNTAAVVLSAEYISPGLVQFKIVVPSLGAGDHAVTAEVNGVRADRAGRLRIQ